MRFLHFSIFTLRKIALVFFAIVALATPASLLAQSKTVNKANDLYKNNQFAAAAELYQQALVDLESEGKTSGRNSTLLKTKLAYCYRMNNKMDKAEELYAEVVKDESAKADTYYYYGEALMSNGKYAEAKKWFSDYQKLEPNDEKATLMLRACDYAPLIEPYFQNLDIQEFEFNTDADDNAPILVKNGLIFSSDRPQKGIKLLKEKSGWTGRDYLNLYFSPLKSDGSFAEPGQFSSKLSEVNKNTGNASLTADETEVFFTRNDNELNKQNTYSLQLFSAKSAGENRWKDVEKLPFCSSNFNFMHPAVSPDGKLLFFATNRAGGFGGTDLWVSERKDGEWGKPENLGPAVNTTANEGFPFVGADGKLYFCSKGHPGFGGFDIFVTYKDENGAWQPATNLGKPINSPLDDISICVAPDLKSGLFTSSRSGGDDDIYVFKVLVESPQTVTEVTAQTPTATVVQPEVQAELAPIEVVEEVVETPLPITQDIEEQVVPKTEVEPEAVAIIETPELEEEEPSQPVETSALPESKNIETIVETVAEMPEKDADAADTELAMTPHAEEPVLPKDDNLETAATAETQTTSVPIQVEIPIVQHTIPNPAPVADLNQLGSFLDFSRKLEEGNLVIGEHFRLDGAIYDPGVWQLTPRITGALDKLISQLKIYPSLQIEISSHTETLGVDEDNLHISENRASMVLDYLLREGISKERIVAKGCGETMPINHCRNGVTCSMEEHLVNQRLEVKVLALDGKW
ncbi:MAG: OmpA family protein [Bacteroidetes bacterium]|nr:OmpA family protein [Bacteroidota bacterium]